MCCRGFKEPLPPHPPYKLIVGAGAGAAPSVHLITGRILMSASANPAEAAAPGSVAAPADLLELAANVDWDWNWPSQSPLGWFVSIIVSEVCS